MEKVAFQFGSFTIYWYGVCVAAGFLAGLWTAGRRAPQAGLPADRVVDMGPWLIVGTIVGARLLYVVEYWQQDFAGKPIWEIFMIRHGGLVFYGGFLGASLACVFFVRAKRLPLWRVADVLAPSLALGYVIGRVGCLMNGCCYGKACSLPWAIHYPVGHETHGVGVHPTQVYESVLNLGLYLVLERLHRRKRFDGQVFASWLMGYAVLRSCIELFRGDYVIRYVWGWLTPGQLVSVGILACGIGLWRWRSRIAAAPTS